MVNINKWSLHPVKLFNARTKETLQNALDETLPNPGLNIIRKNYPLLNDENHEEYQKSKLGFPRMYQCTVETAVLDWRDALKA
jgi:hypothetical protein